MQQMSVSLLPFLAQLFLNSFVHVNKQDPGARFQATWYFILCITCMIVNDIRVVTWMRFHETL